MYECLFVVNFADIYAAKAGGPEILFYYAFRPGPLASRVRELLGLVGSDSATDAQLVLLDLRDDGAFYMSSRATINEESVGALIAGYHNKSIERKNINI